MFTLGPCPKEGRGNWKQIHAIIMHSNPLVKLCNSKFSHINNEICMTQTEILVGVLWFFLSPKKIILQIRSSSLACRPVTQTSKYMAQVRKGSESCLGYQRNWQKYLYFPSQDIFFWEFCKEEETNPKIWFDWNYQMSWGGETFGINVGRLMAP